MVIMLEDGSHQASIGGMKLKLQELQEENDQAQRIRAEKLGKGRLRRLRWCFITRIYVTSYFKVYSTIHSFFLHDVLRLYIRSLGS